jgi:hypothetical protein
MDALRLTLARRSYEQRRIVSAIVEVPRPGLRGRLSED